MIGYLEGRLAAVRGNTVLLQTAGGVGYEVHVPLSVLAEISGSVSAALHVATVVRDDAILLYGFGDAEAKALFETLIAVSGIGPKAALAMLSAFSPDALCRAIVAQDVAALSTVPGIGRKTATRLCVDLGDRLIRQPAVSGAALGGRADLISALTNLGFPEKDVNAVLRNLPADDAPFEDQLRAALALLNKS